MRKLVVDLDGIQSLVDLTPDEISAMEQIADIPKPHRTIDKRRLRMALFMLGLLDSLEAAIDAAGPMAIMQWQDTTIFHEDSQLVQSLIQGLGWDALTVDSIFDTAYSIL